MLSVYRQLAALAFVATQALGALSLNTTCFTGGQQGACTSFINTFCDSAGGTALDPHDSISRCFNAPGGFRCDLTAWNRDTVLPGTPDATECALALEAVGASCPLGGQGDIGTNIRFTLDPDVGPCPSGDVVQADGN